MQFDTWASFVAMGGHGLYVWCSFGFAVSVLVFNIAMPIYKRRQLLFLLQKRARQPRKDR